MLDRYGGGGDGDEKSETLALAEGSLSNSDNESSDDDDEDHEQHDSNDFEHRHHHHRVKVSRAATDSGTSELVDEVEQKGNGHGSFVCTAEAGDMSASARHSKYNQSNGVRGGENANGSMVKEQHDGRSPVGTDNEIVDEAEVGESEEEEQERENQTGNNTV